MKVTWQAILGHFISWLYFDWFGVCMCVFYLNEFWIESLAQPNNCRILSCCCYYIFFFSFASSALLYVTLPPIYAWVYVLMIDDRVFCMQNKPNYEMENMNSILLWMMMRTTNGQSMPLFTSLTLFFSLFRKQTISLRSLNNSQAITHTHTQTLLLFFYLILPHSVFVSILCERYYTSACRRGRIYATFIYSFSIFFSSSFCSACSLPVEQTIYWDLQGQYVCKRRLYNFHAESSNKSANIK